MIKIEIKLDNIDYNNLVSKMISDKWKNPVVDSVIKYIPAKEQIAVSLISKNKNKIIDALNKYTDKENIPIQIQDFNIDRIKQPRRSNK